MTFYCWISSKKTSIHIDESLKLQTVYINILNLTLKILGFFESLK